MSGPSRRIRITTPAQVTPDGLLFVTRRQDNRLYLRGEVFWNSNAYAYGDLLNILRVNGFGVAADTAEGHGQAVSMMQLVGGAYPGGDPVLIHSDTKLVTNALVRSTDPNQVKMELSTPLQTIGLVPAPTDPVRACGQFISAIKAIAMPTSQWVVPAIGQWSAKISGYSLGVGSDTKEVYGIGRGYFSSVTNPYSDPGLRIAMSGAGEESGILHGNPETPIKTLMSVEHRLDTFASADSAKMCSVNFFVNGAAVYHTLVIEGEACLDPVATGVIDPPVKESSYEYEYAYSGWSLIEGGPADPNALSAVTDDLVVYAAFAKTYRVEGGFTVESGEAYKSTHQIGGWGVTYHGDPIYEYDEAPESLSGVGAAFKIGDSIKTAKKVTATSVITYTYPYGSSVGNSITCDELYVYYYDVSGNRIGKYTKVSASSYGKIPGGTNVTRTRGGTLSIPANAEYMLFAHFMGPSLSSLTNISGRLTIDVTN